MTDAIYRCPDHGYVTASEGTDSECPECGRRTEQILSGQRRRRLSKFVSGALRHFPGDADIELDGQGRTDCEDLADAVTRRYDWAESTSGPWSKRIRRAASSDETRTGNG